MNRLKSNRVRGPERLGRPYNVTRLGSAGPTGTKARSAHTLKKIFRLYIQARNSQRTRRIAAPLSSGSKPAPKIWKMPALR